MNATIVAVNVSATHTFSKPSASEITLLEGLGVEGDAHCGSAVKHRSRVAKDPGPPNLRQVHLIHAELFEELRLKGFSVGPGALGENITTRGLDLLGLPTGTELRLGPLAIVRLTGLRTPCAQLDHFQQGLMAAVLDRATDGTPVRKSGVMGVVLAGGRVRPGDSIAVSRPPLPHVGLEPV